ncbi:HNH homing endonuclease [Pectobacterium phage POP72]|uniref:HNH homing endonuclease n=2 Tax=Axomammavirus PP1 TaxID=2733578 RepID=A0A2R2V0S6_9CAUD|nr:HNH endonuclease [Pectobacterium phage PP1]AFP33679.1 putative HNH endonuclease [Pectobacterium phage PP1]ARB10934.1 HNH homing endonuclease [Pectobacterium phage POP72]
MQEWKSITSYPNYAISNMGEVKNIKTGRILKHLILTKGYHGVRLYHEGNGKTLKVHRLVALAFIHNPDNLPQVNHLWGDKGDNRHTPLEWSTNADNMAHAIASGLQTGKSQFKQVYNADDFNKLKSEGITVSAIARLFNCKHDTVYRLLKGTH